MRRKTTRQIILDQLRVQVSAKIEDFYSPCKCADCRIANARDVNGDGRIYQITPHQYDEMCALTDEWTEQHLNEFTLRLFGKVPCMLREIEAAAVIAHLQRGDV